MVKQKKISEDEQKKLIEKAYTVYLYHHDQYAGFREQVKKNNSMIRPDGQWDNETLEKLNAQQRAVVTINKLLSYVMAIMGISVQSQSVHKVVGVNQKSDAGIAEIGTRLLLHFYNQNNYQDTKEFVRLDGVRGRIGIYGVTTEKDDNGETRIIISRDDNRETLIDPDAKDYFQKDWKFVVDSWWMSLEDIYDAYPKYIKPGDLDESHMQERWKFMIQRLASALREMITSKEQDFRENVAENGMFRVIQLQCKKRVTGVSYVSNVTGATVDSIDGMTDDEKLGYSEKVDKKEKIEFITIMPYSDTLLDYEALDLKYFPKAGVLPMYMGDRFVDTFAWVENLFGLQKELNKTRTASAEVSARQGNGMVVLPPGEAKLKQDWVDHGSEYGVVLSQETNGTIQYPDQHLPTHHMQTLELNAKDWDVVSGLPPAVFGLTTSEDNGQLYAQKIRQSSVVLAPLFANMNRGDKLLSMILLEMFPKVLTADEIRRICGEDLDRIESLHPGSLDRFLSGLKITDYDVTVIETEQAQSVRFQKLKELQEMIKSVKSPELSEIVSLIWISLLPTDDASDDINVAELIKNYIKTKYGQLLQMGSQEPGNPDMPPNPQGKPGNNSMMNVSQGGYPPT